MSIFQYNTLNECLIHCPPNVPSHLKVYSTDFTYLSFKHHTIRIPKEHIKPYKRCKNFMCSNKAKPLTFFLQNCRNKNVKSKPNDWNHKCEGTFRVQCKCNYPCLTPDATGSRTVMGQNCCSENKQTYIYSVDIRMKSAFNRGWPIMSII